MKIAAAQTKPVDGNISANLSEHYRLAELAAENGVDLLVFPEMSLTGYQMESAEKFFFSENDARLDELKNLSVSKNILIAAGAPVKLDSKLYIGLFIFHPAGEVLIYTKQFLHEGEEEFFSSSFDFNPLIKLSDEKISFAVCADINNPQHPENAGKADSTLYIASIFYTPNAISECHEQLGKYAKTFSMNVLMANYGGPSYKFEAAGQSAFWTNKGEKVLQLNENEKGLLIIDTGKNKHTGQVILTT